MMHGMAGFGCASRAAGEYGKIMLTNKENRKGIANWLQPGRDETKPSLAEAIDSNVTFSTQCPSVTWYTVYSSVSSTAECINIPEIQLFQIGKPS